MATPRITISTYELEQLIRYVEATHFRLVQARAAIEKTVFKGGHLVGNLEDAMALMRLSRAASDLAYTITTRENLKQQHRERRHVLNDADQDTKPTFSFD